MPDPGALRRDALAEDPERLVRLLQRLARAPQIPQRLRRPGECARESFRVARARPEEFGEERLEAMAPRRGVAHDKAGLLERREELPRRAPRHDRLVVLDALEKRPAKDRVLILARPALQHLGVEVGVELGPAALELAELPPATLADERRREPEPGRPTPGARVHRVDGLLRHVEPELPTEELDRFGARKCELGRGDVEHRSGEPPAWKATELRSATRGEDEMGVVGEDVHELVPERGERRAAAQARMIVEEEGQLTERCELVRESLRQLHETAFEATAAVEKGRELSTELGGIAAQSADEIGEKDERILIPTLKGEPSGVPARGAQEIGVLGEESRLPKPRGRVYEREPM